MKYIDLHVHTNCSDGTYNIEFVVSRAIQNNVGVLSLSEHYNISSYKKAKQFANGRLEIIPSMEVGTNTSCLGLDKNCCCHLLIYYPPTQINEILEEYEISREVCIRKTIKKLKRHINITLKDVAKHARNPESIGRFDIAIALYKLGYSSSPKEAYGDFLDRDNLNFVERNKPSPFDLLIRLKNIGGVPCLAHPNSLRMPYAELQYFINELKKHGLKGVEVYTSHTNSHTRQQLLTICNTLDLIPLAGSDFHGRKNELIDIGTGINNNICFSNYDIIERLKNCI